MKGLNLLAGLEIFLALALWALGLWGLAAAYHPIRQYLYFFAWYPYLLCLDGVLYFLNGESWLLDRPREFLRLGFWSVTAWLIFEALNLVLKNWAYEGLTAAWWLRWPGYALAFATVLPGVLLSARVLEAAGAWRGLKGRPLRPPFPWQPVSLLVGIAFLVLPLIFPRFAFALVWGAFFFLLDPCCDLLGGESLVAQFLQGERRQHLCLVSAGGFCGFWWEMWNFPASAKWVYTLPVLNFWKVFEMPLVGYLGFLPFALECAVMYNFIRVLEERVLTDPRRWRRALLLQGLFWVLMFAAMDAWTVVSFR